jgi:CBS domain-containing protein
MVKQFNQMRVKDVMIKQVVAINPDDLLHEALELICENRVSALPVVDSRGHCLGMLSTSDLIDFTHELDDELHNLGRASEDKPQWLIEQLTQAFGSERVSDQMTANVATIDQEAAVSEAAATMMRNRVHRLPVTDDQNKLLGIISTMDIMSVIANGAAQPAK